MLCVRNEELKKKNLTGFPLLRKNPEGKTWAHKNYNVLGLSATMERYDNNTEEEQMDLCKE